MSRLASLKQLGIHALDEALSILFVTRCLGCNRVNAAPLCNSCEDFTVLKPPYCLRCGIPLTSGIYDCGECRNRRHPSLVAIRSLWLLNEVALKIMHQIKYASRYENLLRLTEHINLPLDLPTAAPFLIVPIPLHPKRFRERGFNQAEVLANCLNKITGQKINSNLLKKLVPSASQSKLGLKQRKLNLIGNFEASANKPPEGPILLVDDIVTTGETLHACAKAIKKKWDIEIYAWTMFRTPKQL